VDVCGVVQNLVVAEQPSTEKMRRVACVGGDLLSCDKVYIDTFSYAYLFTMHWERPVAIVGADFAGQPRLRASSMARDVPFAGFWYSFYPRPSVRDVGVAGSNPVTPTTIFWVLPGDMVPIFFRRHG
jgi:hypothetical protein